MIKKPFVLLLVTMVAQPVLAQDVQVKCLPARIERQTFDRRHPPSALPANGASGVTRFSFQSQSDFTYEIVSQSADYARARTTIRLKSAQITLALPVVSWVPDHASVKLKDHEEGHIQILERIYLEAQGQARTCALSLIGKQFTGIGADDKQARLQAKDEARQQFQMRYNQISQVRASRLNSQYDRLTDHGRNSQQPCDQAVQAVFRQ